MSKLLKIFLFTITFIVLILLYFLYTPYGKKHGYAVISYGLSKKVNLPLQVLSIDAKNYPFVKAEILIDKQYSFNIRGFMQGSDINATYTLTSDCLKSNICTVEDQINIHGTIKGKIGDAVVTGAGKVLDGKTHYSWHKKGNVYNDIIVESHDINSTKLFILLGQTALFQGQADVSLHFDYIAQERKKGTILYTVTDNHFYTLKTALKVQVDIMNEKHTFNMHVNTPELVLDLTQGTYNQDEKKAHALYTFNVPDLTKLEKVLHKKYYGELNASGEISYDKKITIKGITKSLGGMTKFTYTDPIIQATLQGLSLSRIAKSIDIPTPEDATVSGTLKYDMSKKTITSNKLSILNPHHSIEGKINVILQANPYLTFDGMIDKYYALTLKGMMADSFINMDYTLDAARLPSHICTIVDDINLSGRLSGSYARLHISGEGRALEGKIKYSGLKVKDDYEAIRLDVKDMHTLKLFTLLGYPTLPTGKADMQVTFDYIRKQEKKGHIEYTLNKGTYKTLPLTLQSKMNINNNILTLNAHATLSTADINISKGKIDLDKNISNISYTVKTHNLAPLEPLIGKYLGAFSATGELAYNETLQLRGLSNSFGGIVDFLYRRNMLYIDLEKVSFKRFMNLFPYPPMLDAQVNGNINYDYMLERLLVNTDLSNTRFVKSDLVDTVLEKSGVDMLKEVFPTSKLRARYQKNTLLGDLTLQNKQTHFYLTNTQLDTHANTVKAHFDLRMQGQEFSGEVYGSLQDPKVNLNLQKLIRYQMDKQLDTYIGKGNRKLMEKIPMGGTAKDMASDVGAGFMEMFF